MIMVQHVMLLDWDGPISNSRTWHMPNCVDPVAVEVINLLTDAGCRCVLTSTIRKHFKNVDAANARLKKAGIRVNWLTAPDGTLLWRTCPDYTALRHLEFQRWYANNQIAAKFGNTLHFIAIDDEAYPSNVRKRYDIAQPEPVCAHNGMQFQAVLTLKHLAEFIKETA